MNQRTVSFTFDVHGLKRLVEPSANGWVVFHLGQERRRRLADDMFFPSGARKDQLERCLADQNHEWATKSTSTRPD